MAVDVVFEDLQITGHRVQRSSELVTQAREQLRLESIRRFRLFASRLLTGKCQLQLARALSNAGVQRPVEGLHTLLGLSALAHVVEQPAERFPARLPVFERRNRRLNGYDASITHPR